MKALLLKGLRLGLGQLVIFFDYITRPQKMSRSDLLQGYMNEQAKQLSLYQFHACPFCVKVRRALHRLNIDVDLHDAKNDIDRRQELLEEGGKVKVPCLRLEQDGEVTWLYESKEIIAYLDERFGAKTQLS